MATASFRILYVWFVILHGRREIVHFNITDQPYPEWVIQQLRESFPNKTAPRYLIFDRDSTFSLQVVNTVKTFDTEPVRTVFKSPWQNGVSERWVGNVRRELLDHVIVWDEDHLRRLLRQYVNYYHRDRTRYNLGNETPNRREKTFRTSSTAKVVALPRIGGLHHRYEWQEAA